MKTMKMTTPQKFDNSICRPVGGFSLVELMVAMLISLLLMAGVVQIFTGTKDTFLSQEGNSRLQENARFTLSRLSEDIGAAGHLGCLDSAAPVDPFFNDLANKAIGSSYDFSSPIFGTDGGGVISDTISIRRSGGSGGGAIRLLQEMSSSISDLQLEQNSAYNSLQQFDILVVGDCGTASIFMITNNPTISGGTIKHAAGANPTSAATWKTNSAPRTDRLPVSHW